MTIDSQVEEVRKKPKHFPRWVKVVTRDETVVLSFGAVEKPMTADQAIWLADELIRAARLADLAKGYRIGKEEAVPPPR
jgi:hypothetical protein